MTLQTNAKSTRDLEGTNERTERPTPISGPLITPFVVASVLHSAVLGGFDAGVVRPL